MIDVARQQGIRTAIPPYLERVSWAEKRDILAYIHIGEVIVGETAEKGGCVHDTDYVESHAFIDG